MAVELGIVFQPVVDRHRYIEVRCQRTHQARNVPLLLDTFGWHELFNGALQNAAAHPDNRVRDVIGIEQLVALLIDYFALVVGDVIIFEQLLADIEVACLDLALCVLDGTRDHAGFDGFAFRNLEACHDGFQLVTGKDFQQRVFEGKIETRRAGIALATGAAAQLIVDTPRLMAFGADDMQAA